MNISYLDKHGLGTLVKSIKKSIAGMYRIRGSAVYADHDFVNLQWKEKEQIAGSGAAEIIAAGLWHKVSGNWVKVDKFEEGDVYSIINRFTTTDTFQEGEGHVVEAGTNIIVIVNEQNEKKWDIFSGLLDLDKYQMKKLSVAIEFLQNELGQSYSDVSELPTDAADNPDIKDGTVAVVGEAKEVYEASVHEGTISWLPLLGNETTVEGMLSLLSNVCPNRPITDDEIDEIWSQEPAKKK